MREGQFSWEDVQSLPDGTVVQQWVQDDTLPTGLYLKERRWVAPFARASREDDYRTAKAFFAAQTMECPLIMPTDVDGFTCKISFPLWRVERRIPPTHS